MRLSSVACLVVLLVLVACAGDVVRDDARRSSIDYGISPIGQEKALWLAASRPGLSAAGKDFLFIGPMSVNRNGTAERYLWFGLSTTIDRPLTGAPPVETQTVILMVDGTPMTFELISWDTGAVATPYAVPVDGFASYAARVTVSQLRHVARANTVGAYVTNAEGRSPLFSPVDGSAAAWTGF